MRKERILIILFILVIIGTFFRFYNLNWGAPFYFHPDERNIATAITQLKFPEQMNPNFYAYGSFPIYIIYFTGVFFNFLSQFTNPQYPQSWTIFTVSFEKAIIISRYYSAYFSTLLIPLLFLTARKVYEIKENKKLKSATGANLTGLLTAFFTATSVGFIQYAHFGTFEIWLSFFSVLLFWLCLKISESDNLIYVLLAGIVFGILAAIKVSFIILILLPILAIFFQKIKYIKKFKLSDIKTLKADDFLSIQKRTLLLFVIAIAVFFLTNPYVFIDHQSFLERIYYESSIALGTLPVFYTGEFINTTPVFYQFFYIFPFIMNPFLTIIFILSIIYLIFLIYKNKNKKYFILFIFFIIIFLSNSFLYVKWTRYLIPTLSFMYIITSIALVDFGKFAAKKNKLFIIRSLSLIILVSLNFLYAISYFITAYIGEDTRIIAINFAMKNIPAQSSILGEEHDFGLKPFEAPYPGLELFNFYTLDDNSIQFAPRILEKHLKKSEYIVLSSQRLLKTRLQDPKSFPNGFIFYSQLFSEKKGFKKIYETPCDFFCRITYLNDPVFSLEQTANIFDRPTVYIFKKNRM